MGSGHQQEMEGVTQFGFEWTMIAGGDPFLMGYKQISQQQFETWI